MPRKTISVAATVTSKGQITIPAAVRKELGLATGTRVRFQGNRSAMNVVPIRRPEPFRKQVGVGNPGIPDGVDVLDFFRELRGHDDID